MRRATTSARRPHLGACHGRHQTRHTELSFSGSVPNGSIPTPLGGLWRLVTRLACIAGLTLFCVLSLVLATYLLRDCLRQHSVLKPGSPGRSRTPEHAEGVWTAVALFRCFAQLLPDTSFWNMERRSRAALAPGPDRCTHTTHTLAGGRRRAPPLLIDRTDR